MILLIAVAMGILYWRVTADRRLVREIEAAGGWYNESQVGTGSRRFARLLKFDFSQPQMRRDLGLVGATFDDAWLAEHGFLDELRLTGLTLSKSAIGSDGVRELLRRQQLHSLIAPEVPITDAEVELLNQQTNLLGLDISDSQLTDAGLMQLFLPRLNWINVSGTPVTSAGLQAWLPQPWLFGLVLDGRQFTPELAARIAEIATLRELHLRGAEVHDAHLALASGISSLRQVHLFATDVGEDAVQALCAAHPEWTIRVTQPDGTFEQIQPKPLRTFISGEETHE